jgi:ABC-2 type transport system permease protein
MKLLFTVVALEGRLLARERAAWLLAALFALLAAYATASGVQRVDAEAAHVAEARAEEQARFAALDGAMDTLLAGGDVPHRADPTDAELVGRELGRRMAALPPGVLGGVAIGQRDLTTHVVHVTTEAELGSGPDQAELASPARQMSGGFDLAFILIYLLPLFIIALTFDVLAGERERGTLALVLSQPVSLSVFVLGKVLVRALALFLAVTLCALLPPALVGAALPSAGLLALYAGLLLAYVSFWLAAGLAVNTWGRSSAGNALALVGVWLLFVVVIPGLVSVAVDAAYPPPSRVALVNLAREAASEAEARLSAIEGGHGETGESRDSRAERTVRAEQQLSAKLEPVVAAFDEQLAQQQAMVNRLRFLSPAIVLNEGLNDVAGSGVARQQRFRDEVRVFHRSYRDFFFDKLATGGKLTRADYAALPRFAFEEEPLSQLGQRVGLGLLGLLGPAALLLALALRGLRRPGRLV